MKTPILTGEPVKAVETATVWFGNRSEEWPVGDLRLQAYRALGTAAARIGRNNSAAYQAQAKKYKSGYRITPEHQAVIDAMSSVIDGAITPEEAMGLLHDYDVKKQRLG